MEVISKYNTTYMNAAQLLSKSNFEIKKIENELKFIEKPGCQLYLNIYEMINDIIQLRQSNNQYLELMLNP